MPLLSFYSIPRRWSQLAETKHVDCFLNKQHIFTFRSDSSQYAIIFPQSLINTGVFTSGIDPDILLIVLNPNNAGLFKDSFFKGLKLIPTSYFNKN